ncbi:hypothetical protein Tco_0959019 [Tanacetum coccineum]
MSSNGLTNLKVGPSRSVLLSFDFPICLQYHLMKEHMSLVFRSNFSASGFNQSGLINGQSFAWRSLTELLWCQKSSRLRTSEMEAVMR